MDFITESYCYDEKTHTLARFPICQDIHRTSLARDMYRPIRSRFDYPTFYRWCTSRHTRVLFFSDIYSKPRSPYRHRLVSFCLWGRSFTGLSSCAKTLHRKPYSPNRTWIDLWSLGFCSVWSGVWSLLVPGERRGIRGGWGFKGEKEVIMSIISKVILNFNSHPWNISQKYLYFSF